jgi:hypothetical protein
MDLLFLSETTALISDGGGRATIQQLTALANLHSSPWPLLCWPRRHCAMLA